MPVEKGDKRTLSIWVDGDIIGRLNWLADKADMTRSKLVGNIIEVGVGVVEELESTGFLFLSIGIRYLHKRTEGRNSSAGKGAVTAWVSKELVHKIDRIAEKGALSRNRLIAYIVDVGSSELRTAHKIGHLSTQRAFKNLVNRLRRKLKKSVQNEVQKERQDLKTKWPQPSE